MSQPPGSPISPLFSVLETPSSGRGVFAAQDIAVGTSILALEDVSVSVILREFQREVCAWCFWYYEGRGWKVRDKSTGNVFCSKGCQAAWEDEQSSISNAVGTDTAAFHAWRAVEKLIKGTPRDDEPISDIDAPRPKASEINMAWMKAENQAVYIRESRAGFQNKANRKAVHSAMTATPDSESLRFLLSGILFRASKPSAWPSLQALAPNHRPYRSTIQLEAHITSYLQLLAILPDAFLPHVNAEVCREIPLRDDHNSFGIRSLEADGSEFLGYGIWIAASYFNHSCSPNVAKRRVGRCWDFSTVRDIRAGEQLCITYLSGDERVMNTNQRRARLRMNWDFECACEKCTGDDVELD
ncbi:Histone-lysine N-methyltransferase set-6 [Coniosporium apollinis]|uniref:Histone-lysine N-methyltransferase set-6 n=2 Tax=Coniosporium TaxID=2810619 RepID=A0ABQ9NUC0_9PEZI|nr:Histone-lysine N-methyltransferase set-6 [Cladosporium sp. JES 115]KAJ9662143.1 Histone-lysine N-methyltransferase set-6 [Coniosporium apollinis]